MFRLRHLTTKHILMVALCSVVFFGLYVHLAIAQTPPTSSWQDQAFAWIHNVLTAIPTILMWVAGITLNLSIEFFVLKMADSINNASGLGSAINLMWILIRDVMNVVFIFGLIYIGIMTILNSEDSGTRKKLGLLILAALLINFSLFIAKFIIDFSNLVAFQIYKLIANTAGSAGSVSSLIGEGRLYGISGAFTDMMGLLSIPASTKIIENLDTGGALGFTFATMIMILVATFVFMAGAILLIIRYVALIIFMILSPIMFLGWVLPKFAKYSSDWWSKFMGYCFFAPAYIFMLFLSLKALSAFLGMHTGGAPPDLAGVFASDSPAGGLFDVILVYFVGIAFLSASLIVGKQMSVHGADVAVGMMNTAQKKVRGNLQSFAGRNTIGRGGGWISKQYDKFQASDTGKSFGSRVLRGAVNTATLGATSDRSLRHAGKSITGNKFGGGTSWDDIDKEEKERGTKLASVRSERKQLKIIKDGEGAAFGSQERIELERTISDASNSQLEELGADSLKKSAVAAALSTSQFESIMKSDKFNDTQKAEIAKARSEETATRLREDPADPQSRIRLEDASIGQLQALGPKVMEANAIDITASQMDDLKKKLTESEFDNIRGKRKKALIDAFNNDPGSVFLKHDGSRKKDKEIAKLPAEILAGDTAAVHMSTGVLKQIVDNDTLNSTERQTLKGNIETHFGGPAALPRNWIDFFDSPIGQHYT